MPNPNSLQSLFDTLPQQGLITWMGIRPDRGVPMHPVEQVHIDIGSGLEGDRFKGRASSRRQVTLIQQEHIAVIAACLQRGDIDPGVLRRNIVVSGINLLALKDKTFRLGETLLEFTGLCHPCSKMETLLGPGGYNAMRGHGGITARVVAAGRASVGDSVFWEPQTGDAP